MKDDIHPQYHKDAEVHCACGAKFKVGSTQKLIETEICKECHPFYTGKEKVIDTQGQIEKFEKRMKKKEESS